MSMTQTAEPRAAQPGPSAGGGHRNLGLALVVIAAAQLMVVLDSTIVNVALPHIQRALGFSGSGLEWVITAYALTFGGLLLLGGRAGDLLGRRRVFVAGLLVFSAARSRVAWPPPRPGCSSRGPPRAWAARWSRRRRWP